MIVRYNKLQSTKERKLLHAQFIPVDVNCKFGSYNIFVCIIGIVVDQNQALRFAIDIARGMEFLHTMEPAIPNLILTSKHVMVGHKG